MVKSILQKNKMLWLLMAITIFSVFSGYLISIIFPFNLQDGDLIGEIAEHFSDHFNFNGSIRRAPVYPFLLGVFFIIFGEYNPFALVLLHSTFTGLISVVIYKIAFEIYQSDKKALFISIVAAANPIMLWYIPRYYVELIFIFFFLLAVWSAFKSYREQKFKYYIYSGLALALACLTKAVMLMFPLFLGGAFVILKLISKKYSFINNLKYLSIIKISLFTTAFMLLFISPWTIRNKIVSGRFILVSSNTGVEFFRGTSYSIDNSYKIGGGLGGEIFSNALKREDAVVRQHVKDFQRTDHIHPELDSIFNPLMKEFIIKTPGKFAVKIVKQIPPFWYLGQDFKYSIIRLTAAVILIILFIFGTLRKPTTFNIFIIITIVYLNLIYAATISCARYSLPLYPLMMIPGSYLLYALIERIFSKKVSGNSQ